jgi:nitrate/TMAO reductase-like tetraheme cytochrome c subunit
MLASLILLVGLMAQPAGVPQQKAEDSVTQQRAEEIETCLACHGDKDMSVTLPSGETQPLHVDHEAFLHSVHGDKLSCTDCHRDMEEIPHDAKPFRTRREFTVAYTEQCKRCHFDTYTKTLDSVHQAAVIRGDRTAPLCVDCHGAHDILPPGQPRAGISRTCASCHEGVSRIYTRSVHGSSLIEGENGDVPVCTDCHRAHDIAGPRADGWRLRTPEICGDCHSNRELMGKYGLSPNVQQTYVADFHGMTASLQRSGNRPQRTFTALCTDCHGIHDITRVDDPESRVIRANLVNTCQSCHPGASENFPAAWLSHYEPSWEKAPLVYGVQIFYAVFIPFIVGGLVLQVLLHFWRVVVNR